MNNAWEVIKTLEATNSRLEKEAIIASVIDNDDFFEGCLWALDNLKTFGVKQVPEKTDGNGKGVPWSNFVNVLNDLVNRNISGNVARNTIKQIMDEATIDQWNYWYRRILVKDLQCGVSVKTLNKAIPKERAGYKIPVFSCQLAEDGKNFPNKMQGKKLCQVKLDGVRVLSVVYPSGRVDQFSRNGKELSNFNLIKDQLKKVSSSLTEPMVFDGEVMSASFQDLMKQVFRKSSVDTSDAVLYVFDMIPLNDFLSGIYKKPQLERSEQLIEWKNNNINISNIEVLYHEVVDLDTKEGYIRLQEINKKALENKYEGIMLKDIGAFYENKRTTSWLKMKPFIEVSLVINDVIEGTGKYKNSMGAIECSGEDSGYFINVSVGSGFTDDMRNLVWNRKDEVVGYVVEIIADAITQNKDKTYSLRFPRFKSFRGFEMGEKI